jgi:K(+)-stimulated pyrophosphate-energized sodium pump
MNILIKLTCLVGLTIAPILGGHTTGEGHGSKTAPAPTTISVSSTTTPAQEVAPISQSATRPN